MKIELNKIYKQIPILDSSKWQLDLRYRVVNFDNKLNKIEVVCINDDNHRYFLTQKEFEENLTEA